MVVLEVRLIENLGEGYQPVLVAPQQSQGLRSTKRPTVVAPASSAADVKALLAPRREQRGALWQRRSPPAPAPCWWV